MASVCVVSSIILRVVTSKCELHSPGLEPIEISDDYIFVYARKAWEDAEAYCNERFDTSLASIHSVDENTQISTLCQRGNVVDDECWIGLNDVNNERNDSNTGWTWSDGSSFDYTNWHEDQPDNSGGDEDCVVSAEVAWPDVKWNDVSCSEQKTFVCNRCTSVAPTTAPTSAPTLNQRTTGSTLFVDGSKPTLKEGIVKQQESSPTKNNDKAGAYSEDASSDFPVVYVILVIAPTTVLICSLGGIVYLMGRKRNEKVQNDDRNHMAIVVNVAQIEPGAHKDDGMDEKEEQNVNEVNCDDDDVQLMHQGVTDEGDGNETDGNKTNGNEFIVHGDDEEDASDERRKTKG